MTDKDEKTTEFKQLSLNLDIPEQTTTDESNWTVLKEPPKYEDLISDDTQTTEDQQTTTLKPSEATTEQTSLSVPKESFNVMPNALQVAAESSMSLRSVQMNLAALLTSDAYVSVIAADSPEVLPSLMDSVTNAVNSADNLLIKMAQVSEKSASMQRAFEYLIRQKEQLSDAKAAIEQKDELYDESVERIKKAIFRELDEKRNAQNRTAQDYIDENDVRAHDEDIIEAEYVEPQEDTDNFDDVPEE